jgi:predicted aspartyl protease
MRPLAAFLALAIAGLPAAQAQAPASYYLVNLNRSSENHLETPVKVNGKPGHLILDTGASTTFIDLSAARQFRLQPRDSDFKVSRISGRPIKVQIAQTQSFAIGEVPVPISEVGVFFQDMGRRRYATDRGSQGTLGGDVLRQLRAVVACYYMRLYLPRTSGSSVQSELGSAGFVPVLLEHTPNDLLTVNARVNGQAARLLVDTGAFTSLFDAQFLQSVGVPLSGGAQKVTGSLLTAQNLQAGKIDRLSFAGYELRKVTVAADRLSEERKAGRGLVNIPVDGILGADLLAINNAFIDYGTMTMWLRRGRVKTKEFQ